MGRTVPSAAILLMQEQAHYSQFKKALAPRDQLALEQLFICANLHVAEAAYTAFELPMESHWHFPNKGFSYRCCCNHK